MAIERGKRPVPISNLEAKPLFADDTAGFTGGNVGRRIVPVGVYLLYFFLHFILPHVAFLIKFFNFEKIDSHLLFLVILNFLTLCLLSVLAIK